MHDIEISEGEVGDVKRFLNGLRAERAAKAPSQLNHPELKRRLNSIRNNTITGMACLMAVAQALNFVAANYPELGLEKVPEPK